MTGQDAGIREKNTITRLVEQADFASQTDEEFYNVAELVIRRGQDLVRRATNYATVYSYYELGHMIVERQQGGRDRAEYGQQVLEGLSTYLTGIFGRGYSVRNLTYFRKFYLIYRDDKISQTPFAKLEGSASLPTVSTGRKFYLSWSHYIFLMGIDDVDERHFYEIESAVEGWSLKELKRQFNSALYERLALSRDKEGVMALAREGQVLESPTDAIKDPLVLEFLELDESATYTETDLESRIIDHLQEFLRELGKGFLFDGRQVRFTFGEKHFHVDLVCYNRILRCYVLFDLKIGELTHQDLGQMQMYVNYYDRRVRLVEENPTIGIVLCKDKDDEIVEMTLPEGNDQIFTSRYMTVLPSKEDLRRLLAEAPDDEDSEEAE